MARLFSALPLLLAGVAAHRRHDALAKSAKGGAKGGKSSSSASSSSGSSSADDRFDDRRHSKSAKGWGGRFPKSAKRGGKASSSAASSSSASGESVSAATATSASGSRSKAGSSSRRTPSSTSASGSKSTKAPLPSAAAHLARDLRVRLRQEANFDHGIDCAALMAEWGLCYSQTLSLEYLGDTDYVDRCVREPGGFHGGRGRGRGYVHGGQGRRGGYVHGGRGHGRAGVSGGGCRRRRPRTEC